MDRVGRQAPQYHGVHGTCRPPDATHIIYKTISISKMIKYISAFVEEKLLVELPEKFAKKF